MIRNSVLAVSAAFLLATTSLAAAQQPPPATGGGFFQRGAYSLTTGVDYSTGKYGGTSSTDILYVPITGTYNVDKWLFKLTVPFISVTGPGDVVRDIGKVKGKTAGQRKTQSGLGDIVAGVTRNVFEAANAGTLVDLTGKVKFGTADASKGLGTGENDYAAQVDLTQSVTALITAFGSIGYRVIGVPSGIDLHNVVYGEVGGSYKISAAMRAGIILDASQSASTSPQREVTAYLTQQFAERWKVQGYVVHGFASGSPDWGGGGTVTLSF